MKISLMKIEECTTVDGPGFRTSIYCAGCVNRCPGCHNPETWDMKHGKLTETREILDVLKEQWHCDVTFTGGDPMYQPEAFAELARMIHAETEKDIWCYSGYTLEEIREDERKMELLREIDVLVDGRFVESQRDETLLFRGSRNQRLIDVRRTLERGEIVLYEYNPFPKI